MSALTSCIAKYF